MKKTKKLVSLLLCAAMALSFCIIAFASSFSDLEGHWAQSYMEDLADKGFFAGYDDGTIRPDSTITAAETLVLLSRFYSIDQIASDIVSDNWTAYLRDEVKSCPEWAYSAIALCLETGIVTKDELEVINLGTALPKELLSVFLVRAMQLSNQALSLTDLSLDFTDAEDIDSDYLPYAKLLVSLEIIQGDEHNQFSPKLGVTRAVVATMLWRGLNYLNEQGLKPSLPEYSGWSIYEGIISTVSSASVSISGFDGFVRSVAVASDVRVLLNGEAAALASSFVGYSAKLVFNAGGELIAIYVQNDSGVTWVQGVITRASASGNFSLTIQNRDTASNTTYSFTAADEVSILQDGRTIAFSSLTTGGFASIKLVGGKISSISSVTTSHATGTISSITYGSTITLRFNDAVSSYTILLDITSLPKITRGSAEISIDRLNVGDEIKVTMSKSQITLIHCLDAPREVSGELVSIFSNVNGTTWTIKTGASDDSFVSVAISDNATAWEGKNEIFVSSIGIGDTVSLVLYGEYASEIYVEARAASSSTTRVEGIILSIDTRTGEIIIASAGKMLYIDASTTRYIISAETGNALKLSDLRADMQLLIYGSYTTSNAFKATSIVVEG